MPWRDYILNNALWKVVSVISAVLIWFAIHSNIQDSFKSPENRILTTSTVSRTLPVTVITTATDMRGFTITPTNVTVTVRAEASVLNNLKVSDVTAFVNLTDVKDEKAFQKRVNVHTPTNVTVVSVVPEEVTVERVVPAESASHRNTE